MDGSNQWYMAIGGHQVGPVSQQEIITNLQNGSIDAETLVFSAGMTQWQKVKDVPPSLPSSKDLRERRRAKPRLADSRRRRRPDAAPTTSTLKCTATRCSSSRSRSIPAKARSLKPAR